MRFYGEWHACFVAEVKGLWLAACVLLFCGGEQIRAQDEPPAEEGVLPKFSEMKLPDAETLLRGKPVDWVVLRNEDVLVVEPVSPRPDTLSQMEEELRRLANVKPKNSQENEDLKQRRRDLTKLQVTLLEKEEDPDYAVETRHIKQIIHHEDHVLQRAEKCLQEGLTALAFELLVYLDRRHKNWPGYNRTANRLLLKEAQLKLETDDAEAAWRFAEELYAKDPQFAGLSALAGQAIDQLTTQSLESNDFRKARHFLRRLAAREPQHSAYEKWTAELSRRTAAEMDAARTAASQGHADRASDLVDRAARIWPDTLGLKDLHRDLTTRYQMLRVGVLHLPSDPTPYPFLTRARERWNPLTALSWFEINRFDEDGPHFHSVPCESWEPADLGREVRFTVRRDRADWETRPRLTSSTLAAELAARLDPHSSFYDERLASNVISVATPSPYEIALRFRRPPLRLESMFRWPLSISDEDRDLNADLPAEALEAGQRFYAVTDDDRSLRAIRLRPEPSSVKQRHLAEIVERKYDDWQHLLQALQRGEISAIPSVDPLDLAALKDDPRFFVLPYSQPVSHLIQFHPHSAPLKNGQLRRALLHAVPREKLLREELLPGVPAETAVARLTASPFATTTPEYNRLLPHPEYEPIRSAGLAATARKELGGAIPPLRIACPPEAEVRRVVNALIVHWKRVGIEVVPIESSEESWDLAYRTLQFREPFVEMWPFLSLDSSATVQSLHVFPERLRRQLMDLERSPSWSGALQVLHQLQGDLLVDAWWIPLWEVDEYCLFRRNVVGLPEKFVNPYQDFERWIVHPWYSTENP